MEIKYYAIVLEGQTKAKPSGVMRKDDTGLSLYSKAKPAWESYEWLYDYLSGDDMEAEEITKAQAQKIIEEWDVENA